MWGHSRQREGAAPPGLKHKDSPEPSFHSGGFDATAELIKVLRAKKDQDISNGLGTLSQRPAPASLPTLSSRVHTFPGCTGELCSKWEHIGGQSTLFTSLGSSEASADRAHKPGWRWHKRPASSDTPVHSTKTKCPSLQLARSLPAIPSMGNVYAHHTVIRLHIITDSG